LPGEEDGSNDTYLLGAYTIHPFLFKHSKQQIKMNQVQKLSIGGVASFDVRRKNGSYTAELIIALIERSIREGCAITKEDICILYWIYKTDNETKNFEAEDLIVGQGWRKVLFTKDMFISHWRQSRNAIAWFKAGLASAILEGKLLVLPIIEI